MGVLGKLSHSVSLRGLPGRAVVVAVAAGACLALGPAARPSPVVAATPAPAINAPSAILIDRLTGRTLYGRDIHHDRPMASCTKIMTALLVIQRSRSLGRTIVAPESVRYSSGIGLEPGDRITIKQALLALVLKSANDAGLTLAAAVGGGETGFVALMNRKAHVLGLRDTHFTNATGSVRDSRHHSSVYDLARLSRFAMRNARFRDLVKRREAVVRWGPGHKRSVRANNLLLHWDWADGVKCGFTPIAGYCLVGSGRPGLRPLITATLHSADREQDALDHVALMEWGSSLYAEKALVSTGEEVAAVPVKGGGEVRVAAGSTLTAVVRSAAPVRRSLDLPARFTAAPAAGTPVGWATYRADGAPLGKVRLVVAAADPAEAAAATTP